MTAISNTIKFKSEIFFRDHFFVAIRGVYHLDLLKESWPRENKGQA